MEKLIKAAEELNDLLFETPQIPTEGEEKIIIAKLKEAVALLEPEDVLTDETINTLQKYSLWVSNMEEIGLLQQIEACDKINQLKSLAKQHDEFKSIQKDLKKFKEVEILQDKMISLLNAPEEEEEPEEEIPVKKEPVKKVKKEKKAPLKVVKEEEEISEKVPEPTKKKEPVEKASAGKKSNLPQKDPTKSNKGIVYMAWEKGEKDQKKLLKLVNNAVKDTTIKGWLSAWEKGKNLPAVANK